MELDRLKAREVSLWGLAWRAHVGLLCKDLDLLDSESVLNRPVGEFEGLINGNWTYLAQVIGISQELQGGNSKEPGLGCPDFEAKKQKVIHCV